MLKNVNKYMVVIFALVAGVNTISAQRDTVYVDREVLDPDALITLATSPANSITCEHRGCKDGTPWSYNCGGAYVKLSPTYVWESYTSDLGEGTGNSFGADLNLGWEWCRKGWIAAPFIEGGVGFRTGSRLDGEKNNNNICFNVKGGFKLLPHSLRLKVYGGFETVSFVTQNADNDPYRGHALAWKAGIEGELPLGFISFYHDEPVGGNLLKVKSMNRISLVYGGSIGGYDCNKYWKEETNNPNIKVTQFEVHIGLKYNFHL